MKYSRSFIRASRNLAILIVSLLLLTLFINTPLFDESPDPAASKLLQIQDMPSAEKNAYIALLGIKSADQFDMFEAGQRLLTYYSSPNDNLGLDANDKSFAVDQAVDNMWLDSLSDCNDRTDDNCFQPLSDSVKNVPANSTRLNTLLERYRQILTLKTFAENDDVDFDAPMPSYQYLIALGKIETMRHFNAQNYRAMLKQIEQELEFWQMVLRQGKSLIAKMVAIARIWGNIEILSELIDTNSLSPAEREILERLVNTLSLSAYEVDISESFAFEFRYAAAYLDKLPTSQKLFTQHNASLNGVFEQFYEPLICLSHLPLNEFKPFYDAVKQSHQLELCDIDWQQGSSNWSWLNLYNLVGHPYLNEFSLENYSDYIARVHDLDGMIKLLQLKLAIRNQSASPIEEVLGWANQQADFIHYPVSTNQEKKLTFECLARDFGRGSLCQISL